ncbi:MAG TPA: SRPBCC family protein [Ilumatobacteraceae bacterium]|jgi:carbon monoxide dehydrogenase subunit G|nr:SRPBCC family protein [Ilumatobacteraceae bacterium]
MASFNARNISLSTVPVTPELIWKQICDPSSLTALTPLVRSIVVEGDLWRWQLSGIEALGVSVAPAFTERMEFLEPNLIRFNHETANDERERAGADGTYELTPRGDKTDLKVDIALTVELPLPRLSAGAVERVMKATMQRTGKRFAVNLYHRLGLDPATIVIKQLRS